MALTQGSWTHSTVGKKAVWTCVVSSSGADTVDLPTKKTPAELDVTRPFTLTVIPDATIDASAAYLDLWGGYADDFDLTTNITSHAVTTAVSGGELAILTGDCKAATPFFVELIPANVACVAAVTTMPYTAVTITPCAYYAFNIDGTNALQAVNVTFILTQE